MPNQSRTLRGTIKVDRLVDSTKARIVDAEGNVIGEIVDIKYDRVVPLEDIPSIGGREESTWSCPKCSNVNLMDRLRCVKCCFTWDVVRSSE